MGKDPIKDIIDKDSAGTTEKGFRKRLLEKRKPSKNVIEVDYENKKLMSRSVYEKDGKKMALEKRGPVKDASKLDKSTPNERPKLVEKVSLIKYEPASDKSKRFFGNLDAASEKYIRSMNKLEKKLKKNG